MANYAKHCKVLAKCKQNTQQYCTTMDRFGEIFTIYQILSISNPNKAAVSKAMKAFLIKGKVTISVTIPSSILKVSSARSTEG